MELENSTLLSIIVGMAGILAELIFHNTLSNSVFGMVLCVILALVILCCAYFALDGISYSMSAARKKEERRQREYDEKLYRLLNRRLSEQVKVEKAIFSRLAKGISIDGSLTGEQGMPFSAETLQELAGQIDRSTTKAAKMVARYGQKSQADTDKVLNDIRKDVLKSLDEIALEVKRLEDCLNEMNFSVADAVPDEDVLFEGQEEAAPLDLFEEQSDEESQEEDKAEEVVLEPDLGNEEQEISSEEIEAILRAASGADTEQEEVASPDLFEEQEEAAPPDLFEEQEEAAPPDLFEEQPDEEAQEEDKAEEAMSEPDLGNEEQEISSEEIEAILRAAGEADTEQDVDGADLSEDSLSDMDMAVELPAEVEALLAEDNAAPSEETEKLPAEDNAAPSEETEKLLAEDNVAPSVDDLSPEDNVAPSEEALLPDDSALLAEAEALLAENNVASDVLPEEHDLPEENTLPVQQEDSVPEESEPALEEVQANEEQKPTELTALDILRMKQEEKEKSKAEQASVSDAAGQEAASGESAEAVAAGGDANKMMSPDDIAALIASMN